MQIISDEIEEYTSNHCGDEPRYLYELYRETHLKVLRPRMLSGKMQGRFLSMMSKMIKPNIVVELGTYTGYSALCLAEGLTKNGTLYTIDNNEELVSIQQKYFDQSPYGNKINSVLGLGLSVIPSLPDNIDLVFIDADKINYSNYYKLLLPKLNVGGILIADNVLWDGKVASDPQENDVETKALIEFNKMVQDDDQVENCLLTIRDGLMMIRKK